MTHELFGATGNRLPLTDLSLDRLTLEAGSSDTLLFSTNSRRNVVATVRPDWVLFKPQESNPASECFPPDILIHGYLESPHTVGLNVISKYPNGNFFDPDFKAVHLTHLAVGYISLHHDISSLHANLILDSLATYMEGRPQLDEMIPSIRPINQDAVKKTWVFRKVAKPLGFERIAGTETRNNLTAQPDINVFFSK